MHFPLSSTVATLATALALVSQGSAYVIDVFGTSDCTGASKSVNVWDNTCADWMGGFYSYRAQAYGGAHQYAKFYPNSNCADPGVKYVGWADGGDGNFRVGDCRNFGNIQMHAAGSSYVVGGND